MRSRAFKVGLFVFIVVTALCVADSLWWFQQPKQCSILCIHSYNEFVTNPGTQKLLLAFDGVLGLLAGLGAWGIGAIVSKLWRKPSGVRA